MRNKNEHMPETHTYPPQKMLPKAVALFAVSRSGAAKRLIKKVHTRRSRRFNKQIDGKD